MSVSALAQAPARLVKDINTTPSAAGSYPVDFLTIGETTYFTAELAQRGRGVWKTDGTAAGTVLVKDFSNPAADVWDLTNVAGTLFFMAVDAGGAYGLWKSDGTTAGTLLVKYFSKELGSQQVDFADLNGLLMAGFVGDAGIFQLWRSDGTAEGTALIAGMNFPVAYRFGFSVTNELLLFVGYDPASGFELWRSNGTAEGTAIVKDIHPGPDGSIPPGGICRTTSIGQTLFFLANDGVNGWALWRSDGTEPGTTLVRPIPSASGFSCLVTAGGVLFFTFFTADSSDTQLWRSDGTFEGTDIVRDFWLGHPGNFTAVDATLFFTAYDPASGTELWKTDGTPAGTALVKDITPGPASSAPSNLVNVDGTLFFVATSNPAYPGDTPHTGLWRSDGTAAGTVAVKDISVQDIGPRARMVAANGIVVFAADDVQTGDELWRSDGTEVGTVLVKDINVPTNSSFPQQMTDVDGALVFAADDGVNGLQLWRSDGTMAGTERITAVPSPQDIAFRRTNGGFPEELASLKGSLLFPAKQDATGDELWITDGTVESTRIVKDIAPGPDSSQPRDFLRIDQALFFTAFEPTTGRELWKSDGTEAGTVVVKDLAPGTASSNPGPMAALNGRLLFVAEDGNGNAALWSSDGTDRGTVALTRLLGKAPELTVSGGFGFFRNGALLWRTDGTPAGTTQLSNTAFSAAGLTDVNGVLFFAAVSLWHGLELWRSDGTVAGTTLVKDINPGSGNGIPDWMPPLREHAVVNDTLLFLADDGTHGLALWSSDGTESGTQLVKVPPTTFGEPLVGLHAVGALAFFITPEPSGVRINLWRTDGTTQGTMRVYNGPGDLSEAFDSAFVGSTFFFDPAADTPDHPDVGNELWALDVAALAPCSGDCNQDGAVTIDELLTAVNIALGTADLQSCPLVDNHDDGAVTIDELLAAVNQALNGCTGSGQP